MDEGRRGIWFGLSAYLLWGLFPLYWTLLEPAGAVEILAHRILWSLVLTLFVVTLLRRLPLLRSSLRERRPVRILGLAGALIALNWGTYIYGVNHDQVVQTSLGYFIAPLVSVAIGVVVFRERLRTAQWVAVGIGAVAVVVLSVDYGHPPWIALVLASSFGIYGLLKKLAPTPPLEGLTIESGWLLLPALGLLAWVQWRGDTAFLVGPPHVSVLMVLAGAVTAIPLLLFAASARRVPLSYVGLMQYLAPVIQFALGVFVFSEPLPPGRLIGFVLVWVALVVFSADLLRRGRRPVVLAPVP